ncbi:hypothetical protein [uncultured Sphingomonas sp.]|uniref:hypothetical protein n=1 Tax=uncultured Sphingomonas sp. TaxID=158754 RepID=UPI0035C9EE4B
MSWTAIYITLGVGVYVAGYLAVIAIRNGANWREVLAPTAMIALALAIAVIILQVEQALVPQMPGFLGDWQTTITVGIAVFVAIAICLGIATVWGKLTGALEARPPTTEVRSE